MPSPSKLSLLTALTVTGGVFYGGALLASKMGDGAGAAAPSAAREGYIPAPVPGRIEPGSPSNPGDDEEEQDESRAG